jgi:hypothetical protein
MRERQVHSLMPCHLKLIKFLLDFLFELCYALGAILIL